MKEDKNNPASDMDEAGKKEQNQQEAPKDQQEPEAASAETPKEPKEADAPQGAQKTKDNKNKTMLIVGAVLVAALAIAGVAYFQGSLPLVGTSSDNSKVLATVNGEEITRAELDANLEQNKAAYEQQGVDLSDPEARKQAESQALEFMVNEMLILQAAEKEGITVSSEDIQNQFDETSGNFETEQAFEDALVENNLTRELLRSNIETSLMVQKYVDTHVPAEDVEVTEEDVQAFYQNYKAQNPEAPELEELREQIEQALQNQNTQALVQEVISELRENADVQIML